MLIHTLTIPSTKASNDSRTKPSEVMSNNRYWWNPAGVEWVWVPLMQTFLSVYFVPYVAFRRRITFLFYIYTRYQ